MKFVLASLDRYVSVVNSGSRKVECVRLAVLRYQLPRRQRATSRAMVSEMAQVTMRVPEDYIWFLWMRSIK